MNIKKIKKLIYVSREVVQGLLLTERQLGVVKFVEACEEITTGDLVKRDECTIQSATAVLVKLVDKGWLTKEKRTAPTGGILFVYKLA